MEKWKTILVIDDEVDLVRLLTLNLNQAGYKVLSAHDGEEGLKLANANSPDLILLDINMPRKGGLDFYKEILASDDHPKFPILVLTARGELKEIFENIHVNGFISKPFEMHQLLKEVERIIGSCGGEAPPPPAFEQKKLPRVLLVDNDPDTFNKIAVTFLEAGYLVNAAKTGAAGIERGMMDRPDVALIKLGLPDLPGDLLSAQLHRMRQASNVPVILYTSQGGSLDAGIAKRICEKVGLTTSIKSDDPAVLLNEANLVLDGVEKKKAKKT